MNIGDVFLALRADGARFSIEAQKKAEEAGDAAGKTLGARIGKAATIALRGGLAFLSAGAALATKGMVELDDAVAEFTADTGASAEEAERARKAINAMSSRNLAPVKEIGQALGVVTTDLGLAGDAAVETTERFLHFGEATHQGPVEAVRAFDDILDAWGKTAADIPGIMDQLVASHERYGGSIAENEDALAAMAPQLQALNLGLDDGIALLNLFASSGLDAASGQKALNAAITKLPAGESLEEFLGRLSRIEDDGQRAQEAMRVFGTRAGAGLANAIKPGVGSLDTFRISTQEAAGATERAADAINSTWGARAQLLVKQFTSRLVELGGSFGPILTGAASLASLGGALGLDKLAKVLVTRMASIGKEAGEGLIDAIGTATGAAGTIIGNFVASRIENVLDPTKPTALGRAIRAVSAKAGILWGATMAAATRVGEFLADVFVKLPGVSALRTAVLASAIKVGTMQGTAMGTAAGVAFRLALVGAVAGIANELAPIVAKAGRDLGDQLRPDFLTDIGRAWSEWRKNTDWPIGQKNAPDWARVGTETKEGTEAISAAAFAGVKPMEDLPGKVRDDLAPLPKIVQAAATATVPAWNAWGIAAANAQADSEAALAGIKTEHVDTWGVVIPKINAGAAAWEKYRKDTKTAQDQALVDLLGFTSKSLSDLIGYQSGVEDAVSGVYNAEHDAEVTKNRIIILQDQLTAARKEHLDKGKTISAAEQADYENTRIGIEGEMQQLQLHLALIGDDLHRESKLQSLLTSKDMAAGLTSQNENVRKSFEVQRDKMLVYLADIATKGGPAGKAAAASIAKFMDPKNPLSPLHNNAIWGASIGSTYLQNLAQGIINNTSKVYNALIPVRGMLRASSPPGPASPLHLIDRWAERTGAEYPLGIARAIAKGVGHVSAAVSKLGGPLNAAFGAPSLLAPSVGFGGAATSIGISGPGALAGAAAPGAGATNQYVLNVHGDIRAPDEASVLRTLQRLSAVARPS